MASFEHVAFCTKAEFISMRRSQIDLYNMEVNELYTAMFALRNNPDNKEGLKLPVKVLSKTKYGEYHHRVQLAPGIPSPLDDANGFESIITDQGDIPLADLTVKGIKMQSGYIKDYDGGIDHRLNALLAESGIWHPTDLEIEVFCGGKVAV